MHQKKNKAKVHEIMLNSMLVPVLSLQQTFDPQNIPVNRPYYPLFTDEEIEAQQTFIQVANGTDVVATRSLWFLSVVSTLTEQLPSRDLLCR